MELLIGLLLYGLRVFVAAVIFHTICEMRRLDLSTFSWIVILAGFVAMSHLSTELVNSWLQQRRARIWRGMTLPTVNVNKAPLQESSCC